MTTKSRNINSDKGNAGTMSNKTKGWLKTLQPLELTIPQSFKTKLKKRVFEMVGRFFTYDFDFPGSARVYWNNFLHQSIDITARQVKVSNNSQTFIKNLMDAVYFISALIQNTRLIFTTLFSKLVFGITATDLDWIPPEKFPDSITLILTSEKFSEPAPPPIPRTSQWNYENALLANADYFRRKSVHAGIEKVRLLSEISRFVHWGIIIPKIKILNVYEKSGYLWSDQRNIEANFNSIADAISIELDQLVNVKESLSIVLIESNTGYERTFKKKNRPRDDRSSIETRLLSIYFNDMRMKDLDPQSQSHIAKSSQLVLVPGTKNQQILSGYLSFGETESSSSVFYFNKLGFGTEFFVRAMQFFATTESTTKNRNNPREITEHVTADSASSSAKNQTVCVLERLIDLESVQIEEEHNQDLSEIFL